MRLKSHIWVSAYLRRLDLAFVHAAVVRRGDPDAGAIYIKLSKLDGSCQVLAPMPSYLTEGETQDALITEEGRAWQAIYNQPAPETDADEYLKRQAERDPDMWILEVESPQGRHLLGQKAFALT